MKKAFSLLLVLAMLLSLTPAFAEATAELEVFVGTETYTPSDINSMQLYQKAEAATGVHINWSTVATTAYSEKLGTLLATDDLPEVIFGGVSATQLVQYGEAGSFIPMEDLITPELMPNLCKILETRPELLDFVTAPDGHIYGLPRVTEGLWNQVELIYNINTQWLDVLDLEMPTNLTEFKEMLIAFRDGDPNQNGLQDEIPLTFSGATFSIAKFNYIFSAYGLPLGSCLLDVVDGEVVCVAQDERYAEGIRYIADLYAEGLIDPDSFVMNGSQWRAKANMYPAIVGVAPNWDYNDNISVPEVLEQYGIMPPLYGDDGTEPLLYYPEMYGLSRGFGVITKACKDPELAAKWLDYWFDPINSIEASEGCIGERQYYDENGTILVGNDETNIVGELMPRDATCMNRYTCRAMLKEYYENNMVAIPSTYPKIEFINEYVLPHIDQECFNSGLYYTLEESETISLLSTDINNLINTKAAEWIMNGNIDEEWDSFQETLKKMNIDEYLATQQAAYDRMYKK